MGVVQLLDIANGGKTVIVCEHFFGAAIVIFLQVELKLIVITKTRLSNYSVAQLCCLPCVLRHGIVPPRSNALIRSKSSISNRSAASAALCRPYEDSSDT